MNSWRAQEGSSFMKKQKYIYMYLVVGFVENAFRNLQCYIIQMPVILRNSFITKVKLFYFWMNMITTQAK